MIKLICCNPDCKYSYEVTEKELENFPEYHEKCLICGSKIEVAKESMEELVKFDLYQRAEAYFNGWASKLGLEGAMELIFRHKNQACYRLYVEELRKRGFIIK